MSTGPVFTINKEKADDVYISTEAYEQSEKMLAHRVSVLEAEFDRISGAPTFSVEEVRARLREKFNNA